MTLRERNLLILFFVVLAAGGLVMGLGVYWDELTRLDNEFVDLQKRALRTTQASALARTSQNGSSWIHLKDRFFAPGALPGALTLASRAQAALEAAGLKVLESRVSENTEAAQWVQYRVEGGIDAWFGFLELLRREDPRTLFRSMSLVKKQDSTYAVTFEVGHVVLP